jgi:hypothetical protein
MRFGGDTRDALLYGPTTRASPPAFVVRRVHPQSSSSTSAASSSHGNNSCMSRSLPSLMRSTPTLGRDLLLFDDDFSDDDDEITDVSKRRGFMRVQARPPTVLAGVSFLNNTQEEGLDRYLPALEAKPLPAPLRHRFTSPAKIARLERSISLTSARLRTEQRRLHGKTANRGLEIVDRLILRDLCAKRGGRPGPTVTKEADLDKSRKKKKEEEPRPPLTLSLPPNPVEVKLMRAQGVLRRLKRQQTIQKQTVSSIDTAFEVEIKGVQADIEGYRRELHTLNRSMRNSAAGDGNDDDEYALLLRNLKSLDPGGGSPATAARPPPQSSSTYEGTDLLRFARDKQWRGPLTASSSSSSSAAAAAAILPSSKNPDHAAAKQHRQVATPLTPSMRQSHKMTPGGGGLLRGILRSPSTAGSIGHIGSSAGGSRKRITWSPMKVQRTYNDAREIPAFDRIPNTAEMGLRTFTRRTEFRKTMGRVTGKEAREKLARRRLSNVAASARAIARIRLAAKRAQKREEKKNERVRRASLGFAGPAPRPNVPTRHANET